MGESKLQQLAQELVKIVRKNAGVDWTTRAPEKAKMRVAVKHLLRKYGYPPDFSQEATETVVKQAEQIAASIS